MAGGAIGGVADLAQGGLNYAAAKEREEAARKWLEQAMADRQAGVNMAQNLDWSPERVRDQVGVFQRSRSPVADAFLESFVTGDNPAAIQGTRYGSKIEKADAQRRFNANYGGWDALRAQQRQLDESTPWAVQNPSGFTYGDEKEAGKLSASEVQRLEQLTGEKLSKNGQLISGESGNSPLSRLMLKRDAQGRPVGANGKYGYSFLEANDPERVARLRRFLAQAESSSLGNNPGSGGGYDAWLKQAYGIGQNALYDTYDNGGA